MRPGVADLPGPLAAGETDGKNHSEAVQAKGSGRLEAGRIGHPPPEAAPGGGTRSMRPGKEIP